MCGIIGAYGEMHPELFNKMLQAISHRGPDHQAVLSLGNLHFGHARLSIIDLSPHSNQPLWDSQHKACIVFNGEIYNYKSLREELVTLGYVFTSQGDAEVIVNLYLHFGIDCLKKLQGMFAFAIWDKQSLFLARDPVGVKPLYYTQNAAGFYFASEMKSLLMLPSLSRDLNYDALYRTILFLWSPGSATVIKAIHKLEAGHYLLIKEQQVVQHEKFESWPKYLPQQSTVGEASQQIEDALLASIKAQMVADVPVGAFLSGGLDSSLIVSMIKAHTGKALQCFTVQSTDADAGIDGFVDDLSYAKIVAETLDIPLNIVDVKADMATLLPKLMYHLDEPQGDPALLNIYMICQLARKKGIKVLFSGAGGDDVFSGYRRHQAILLERFWRFLPGFIRRGIKFSTHKMPKKIPMCRRLAKLFAYADALADERLLAYFFWLDPKILRQLFVDEVQEQLSPDPTAEMLAEIQQETIMPPLEKMLMVEKRYFLVDHNLNYTDKMSMAHGVEVRVPFLDSQVMKVAASLPVRFKHRYGQGKWILKKMARKYLPLQIIYRPKTGFGAPLRTWLQRDLKPMVDDLLSVETVTRRGVFNPEKIQSLILQNKLGQEDFSYPIFTLLCFELWCQMFIDAPLS